MNRTLNESTRVIVEAEIMDSFNMCTGSSDFYLLASGVKSFFLVIATDLLAGEVDTTLADANLQNRVCWMLIYYNPVNLSWRYYSILAYRLIANNWGEKQLTLINYEAHPFKPPVPYIVTENVDGYQVRRLDCSGVCSSQGLLTVSAAYQAVLALHFVISTAGISFLPNITMPIAVMGSFRVMVFPWIASKVYVDPYPYPDEVGESDYRANKVMMFSWISVLTSLVFLSFWPYIAYPAVNLPRELLQFSVQVFYLYVTISVFLFHVFLLSYGPKALGNRIIYFDAWLYKFQTWGFVGLLLYLLVLGIVDFVIHAYYRSCV